MTPRSLPVAVTGLGVKSPAGSTITEFWARMRKGVSVAAPITRFDTSDLRVHFACEVADFDPREYFDVNGCYRSDRFTQLAFGAAIDALTDSRLDAAAHYDVDRCAVIFGTGTGGGSTSTKQLYTFWEKGPDRISPLFVPMSMPNAAPATIAIEIGWRGPNFVISSACASGANAIGEAARLLQHGEVDAVLVGGAEAGIERHALATFGRMKALSTRNDAPELASRPFDTQRDGYVMGEGAGFMVLERPEDAARRGAKVYCELLGYGRNTDAHHITAPSPGGVGAIKCMRLALADAGVDPGEVSHVNAHGTSTELNDLAEGNGITEIFGAGAVPVTASKGVFGHLLGGAGAVEALVSVLSYAEGTIPPTANHTELDPRLEIDVVTTERPAPPGPVLSNSFGFGGHNASLLFGGNRS
jgi:3-oxoacyl-[acyl-carrier-protein] synthase II